VPDGRHAGVVALCGAGLFLAAADAYAVAALLPRMMADVSLPVDQIEQATPVISGFLAGYVVAMPLLGAVSDRRGRVPVYLAGLAVFAAGSLVTALAPSLAWLLVGRAVQGLGGGALVPVTLALAADVFTGAARDRALGAVSALQEAGSVVGPAYGAALAGLGPALGWRFVFFLNVPLAVVVGGLVVFGARRSSGFAAGGAVAGADLPSAAALGLGLGALVLALYPDDPAASPVNRWVLPLGASAVVLLGFYGWRQVRRLSPLVPPRVLRSPAFLGALLTNLLVGGGLMAVLLDVPVFARGVFGITQSQAGLLLTSFLVGVPVGAGVGGVLSARVGRRLVSFAGLVVAAGGFWVLASWDVSSLGQRVGVFRAADLELVAMGAAFGVVIAPIAAAALEATQRREHGLVSSLVVTARTVGMLAALSALTAFGLHRFNQLLAAQPGPADSASLHDRLKVLEANVTRSLVLEYHDVFRLAALLCAAAAVVAAVSLGGRRPRAAGPD
jgi:MFS transporter, DHA2 family, triacylglyceride efflux pump